MRRQKPGLLKTLAKVLKSESVNIWIRTRRADEPERGPRAVSVETDDADESVCRRINIERILRSEGQRALSELMSDLVKSDLHLWPQ